ncbi:hypothetical protein [Crocinitomix catalasitica]|uniref:hypothetical protein n=1 Tax=Crocinitomix catalasitica TaxID=184607 RepID=UPI0004899367|nr:hypothetical protein [Crocinitomix catalasitica]
MKKLILILAVIGMTTTVSAQFDFDYIIGMDYENVKTEYESYNELGDTISCTLNNTQDGTEIILANTSEPQDNADVLFEIHLDYDSVWNQVNRVVVTSKNSNSDESLLDFFIRNSKVHNWEMVACNQFVSTRNTRNIKSKNDNKLVSYLVASLDNNDFVLSEQSMSKDEWIKYKKELKR